MPSARLSHLAALLTLLAMLGACEKPSAVKDDSKVIASVNGIEITEKNYESFQRVFRQQVGPGADEAQEKKTILDELINRMLLAQQAHDAKLDQDPEVYYALARVRENFLIQALMRDTLKTNPITDDEIRKRFEQEVQQIHKTEYKVQHILLPAEDQAKAVIGELKAGKKFDALARSKSIDSETGRQGGDLGWVNQGMVVPEFFDAVVRMKRGEVSEAPVKTNYGWHVIRLVDTRPLKVPSVDQFMADRQAKAGLYRRIQDERLQSLVKDLRAKAKITTN
jgi:peptidyl-prolyl cis-trans isomerase C